MALDRFGHSSLVTTALVAQISGIIFSYLATNQNIGSGAVYSAHVTKMGDNLWINREATIFDSESDSNAQPRSPKRVITRSLASSEDQLILATYRGVEIQSEPEWIDINPKIPITTMSESDLKTTKSNLECDDNEFDRLIAERNNTATLSHPIITDNRFENPFPTWSAQSFQNLIKWMLSSNEVNVPKDKTELDQQLPVLKPDFNVTNAERAIFRATWIGHATVLIQVNGFNILADPIFSDRASFTQYVGPKRIRPPACDIDSLPEIHAVIISHNHYDHLDSDSVESINKRFGERCKWLVPLGLGSYLQSMSVKNYVELDWWQKTCLTYPTSSVTQPSSPAIEPQSQLSIYLTPTQHWSRRGINDINRSLWGSYTIVSKTAGRFFFTGDTGYCSAFKEIGDIFGPFSGAAIPIGAYSPRWFMKSSHVDPQEAVQIHRDLRSKKSFAIHHSTFMLTNEYYKEPAILLDQIMQDLKTNHSVEEPFVVLHHGETTNFPEKF